MAEESDNVNKPKAQLIKHSQSDQETNVQKEQGERRKVVVVKKKTPQAAGKKVVSKVIVSTPSTKIASQKTDSVLKEKDAAEENDIKQDAQIPSSKSGAFQISQRPSAVAGKVGGKFVGQQGQTGQNERGQTHKQQRPPLRPPRPPAETGHPKTGSRSEGHGAKSGFIVKQNQGQRFAPHTATPAGSQGRFTRPSSKMPLKGGLGVIPSGPLPEGKTAGKRKFVTKKIVYNRKEKELEMEEKLLQTKKKITHIANPVPKTIEIMEVISVSELARKMNLKSSDIIHKLMSMGQMVTINQQIDAETATILAAEYGSDVKIVSLYDETVIETVSDENAILLPRPPVVTIMGHVDHGKTKLLDVIRQTDVISSEFGGITQHIGAYMVETNRGGITFLDTPGHEAFTRMRARGAQITDIVVLVVAADDGVMPQTVEAINHAKDAEVPIIVAVNKVDKPEANPEKVKRQLSEYGLMAEDWGGHTMFVEISALQNTGIDKLIDAINLESELLELKANFQRHAEGKILESKIDHGRGNVATVMIEKGTLSIGDSFVAGIWPGRVRAIFNDKGEKITKATPSMPVEVIGFEGIPNAGDPLHVVGDDKIARGYSSKRQELKRFEDSKSIVKTTMANLHDMITEGAIQELKVIIKSDVQGSAEALKSSLEKLSTKEIRLHVIQALPGPVTEGDVNLAIASKAIIISFNVRPLPKAKLLAEQEKIEIKKYNIIYKAVEETYQAMEGMLKPDIREDVIGLVEIQKTYKVPKIGVIAGCQVKSGSVKRNCTVNVLRDHVVIHSGKIASLKRFKDDAREVLAGFECGIGLEGFDDIKEGDTLEVIEIVKVARKLSSS